MAVLEDRLRLIRLEEKGTNDLIPRYVGGEPEN